MKLYIALLISGLAAVSCTKKDMTATVLSENTQTTDTAHTTVLTDSAGIVQAQTADGTVIPVGGTAATTPVTTSASGTLNPEHGKPGHRCDIPVGAPLSSAPSVNMARNSSASGFNTNPLGQSPTMSTAPAPAPVQAKPQAPGKTAPGMNPPHGEPGHRCDIPVGSPLSTPVSTPTQTVTPTSAESTPAPQQNLPATVAAPAPSGDKVVTAPGMNPPHGEPGHRCDIAVGAPLK